MKLKVFLAAICTLFLTTSSIFGYQTTFTPILRANVDYTDNINQMPNNEESDTITTVSPGGTLDLSGESAGLTISYRPTYASYNKQTENDTWRHYGRLSGWWDMNKKTRLNISDNLTISEDPQDDQEDPALRRGRNKYRRNTTNINIAHQFGLADSFNFGYIYSFLENDNDFFEDSYSHNPYVGVTWWFVPNNYGIDLGGNFNRGEFDQSDDFDSWSGNLRLRKRFTRNFDVFLQYAYMKTTYDGQEENYKVNDGGIGLYYIAGENIDITFAVSYVRRDREVSNDQDGIIATWDINANWNWRRSSLSLNGTSGYSQNTFSSENEGFYYYSQINGNATYQFTRYFSGDIFAGYNYYRYLDIDPKVKDHLISAGCGLSWQALEWMQFNIQYAHRTLDSNEWIREYDENRVLFGITLSPARPSRASKY
jgi:hypothetical protein